MRLPVTSASAGNSSSPSLSSDVTGTRASGMPAAASVSAVPGPGAYVTICAGHRFRRRRAEFDGIGRHEHRDVVIAKRRMRALERLAIRRRQDHDRRPDDRHAAERTDLRRQHRRLSLRPRDDDADALERPGFALRRRQRVDITGHQAIHALAAIACLHPSPSVRQASCGRDGEPMTAAREEFVRKRSAERLRTRCVDDRAIASRRARHRDRRAWRAGRAATADPPPTRRTRRAAC